MSVSGWLQKYIGLIYEIDQPDIYFFSHSITNPINVLFTLGLSTETFILQKTKKIKPMIYGIQTRQRYLSHLSNTLWKPSLYHCLPAMFCCFSTLNGFSFFFPEVWTYLDVAILFCSRYNNVSNQKVNYSNLKVIPKGNYCKYFTNLRSTVTELSNERR